MNQTQTIGTKRQSWVLKHPLLRKYMPLVHEDLTATYSRDLHKWLIIAPIIGVATGLTITAIAIIMLGKIWPVVLHYYLGHHWAIVPGLVAAFAVTGLIMQFLTPDPDEHSTEEVIRSYHEHQGDINMRPFFAKLLAAVTTVAFGGSSALEGPSIYGGASIGSWLWAKLRWLRLDARDRRIMLICGAAAGMSAVFRAPLTGIVFALEMPYKDDLAHEALVPSLIASVISYVTLSSFLGGAPLFDFASNTSFTGRDLFWCALLGLVIGLIAMAFVITFRRLRTLSVKSSLPHWIKMVIGGALTGLCGVIFLYFFHGSLVPLGPNYEAVGMILGTHHSTLELVVFGVLKLAATAFTLGVGGVSAMFVPLFLSGGSFGVAFAQAIVHSSSVELYAAVGMAAFIAAGYKTPLAAVVFVAEATGGHAFIIPALIGSAVAYAVSGDASASGDQKLHEGVRVQELRHVMVGSVMQQKVMSVQASLTLREFTELLSPHYQHSTFPVFEEDELLGVVDVWSVAKVATQRWETTRVRDLTNRHVSQVSSACDVMEGLRLLLSENKQHMLLVTSGAGKLEGIVTKTDILQALKTRPDVVIDPEHEVPKAYSLVE
jgi:CIC family chloride channel protein